MDKALTRKGRPCDPTSDRNGVALDGFRWLTLGVLEHTSLARCFYVFLPEVATSIIVAAT